MAIVKNLRDHEVYFTPFDVVGARVIDDYPAVFVGAGETVEVPDACAYGAPEVGRLGLVYEDSGWELVGSAKSKRSKARVVGSAKSKRSKARVVKGDGVEKTAIEGAEITGNGTGEALPPADDEQSEA